MVMARKSHRMIGLAAAASVCAVVSGASALAQGGGEVAGGGQQEFRLRVRGNAVILEPVAEDQPSDEELASAAARLERLAAELGSSDFAARERASAALSIDYAITLSLIERVLLNGIEGQPLNLEARSRLLAAARDRFFRTHRAAMGIEFWRGGLRDRVVINRTFPEFEAARKLEEGDMIVEADGHTLQGPLAQLRLQSIIVSHDPGEIIRVVVRRGDKKIPMEMRLGRREQLEQAGLSEDQLLRAWQVRSAAIEAKLAAAAGDAPAEEPVRTELTGGQWLVAPVGNAGLAGQARLNRAMMRQKGMDIGGPELVGGGMPRGASLTADQLNLKLMNGQIRNNRAVQAMLMPQAWQWDLNADSGLPAMSRRQELEELARAKVKMTAELRHWDADQDLAPNDRRIVEAARQERAKMLRIVERQIDAIRAEMAELGEPPYEPEVPVAPDDPDQLFEVKEP